jgi:membrane fusion protein (multidrug efflux system)
MRRVLLIPFFILLAACEQGASAPPYMPGPSPVTVVTLQSESITLTRELPGRVTPFLVAEVRPQVTGIVQEQMVNEGGVIEAGQVLYQLDDANYRANYNSARASLTRANVALEIARINAARSEQLVQTGAISKQNHDNSIALLRQAEADVGVAQAAVASSEVTLNFARITAPINGRIGRSSVTKGALVTSNQADPMVTVQQLDPIYIDLTQSSAELLELREQVQTGTLSSTMDIPVTIMLENGAEYEHDGKLKFSEVSVDPSTGSYMLRVEVSNPDNLLLPGMYVRARLGVGMRENALLVPQQGIARDPTGNAIAMVVDAESKVEQRAVQVSRTVGNKWLVDTGLLAGDQVIIEGLQKIRPGMPVEVTDASSSQ